MSNKRDRMNIEREVLASAGPTLLNEPPKDPYYVDCNVDLVAERIEKGDEPNINLKLWPEEAGGWHVETACHVSLEDCRKRFHSHDEETHELFDGYKMLDPENVTVMLDYPLGYDVWARIPIRLLRGRLNTGDAVYAICQAYRMVYADPEKYGIWGHAMRDLHIEKIGVDTSRGIIEVWMGS